MQFLDQKKIEEEYKREFFLWGTEPNRYVRKIPKLIHSGNVLDIGVGEGRNALFLAKHGFNVTGIDISKEAVNKFLSFAEKDGLKVKGIIKDITNFQFDVKYDVIICIATLHLILKNKILETVNKIKGNTKKNGINIITVFTKRDIGFGEYPNLYFFEEDEIKNMYEDWKILDYSNYLKRETHGKIHKHRIAGLIARKMSRTTRHRSLYLRLLAIDG